MWTWEKILKCEEIKSGVIFEYFSKTKRGILLEKYNIQMLVYLDGKQIFFGMGEDYEEFRFFHTTSEEILPPKERETITLYETMNDLGDVRMCDENGFFPDFIAKKMYKSKIDHARLRRANINKNKSVVLYADTFEVKEWRN